MTIPITYRRCFWLLLLVSLLAAGILADSLQPTCAACGRTIDGPRLQVDGRYYHPDHFTCDFCNRPITSDYMVVDGKNYHNSCYERHIAVHCAHCGLIIRGEYLVDYWGNPYHAQHQRDARQCKYCSRFISDHLTNGGTTYRDGRTVCGSCLETAVHDEDEAGMIMREVAGHLAEIGIEVDPDVIDLHLIDLGEMVSRFGKQSHNLRGFVDYHEKTSMLGVVKERTIDLYLVTGMPRRHTVTTLAHEMTHVWQYLNGRLATDPLFSEGSCNYAAFLVLLNYPGDETEYVIETLLKDDDPIYGEGFRRVMAYAESVGTGAWLRRLRSQDNLPRGY
ncbi:protein DA1 [candidate division GN15 bacterium]|nr:protein DA1 [candidate division GN15 bacterium]